MKIPKIFIFFLVVIQIALLLGHWALLSGLVFFFPVFAGHTVGLAITLFVLGISFLAFSILTWRSHNFLLRAGYILSAIWMPTWFYLLLAVVVSLVARFFLPGQWVITTIFVAALLLSLYGVINARILRTIHLRVKLPNLPENWKGKTAVLVTDMHLGHVLREGFALKIVEAVNTLKPDIVFMPGDLFDGVKADFTHLSSIVGKIRAQFGIYFVSGNHEMFAGYAETEAAIRASGITILENEKIELNGLQIAGFAYGDGVETPEKLERVLHSLTIDRTRPSVLLKHVPSHVKEVAHAGFSLMLSGHSHHGQVWPGRYITKKVFQGFDYGLKKLDQLQVYTSSGAGTWGPPMRVFTKSEIVCLTFE